MRNSPPLIRGLALLFLALLVVPAGVSGQRSSKFDPDGAFWIFGEPPQEFKDFSGIVLNARRLRRLPGAGVDLTNGTKLRFRTLSVSRERFVFSTVALRGVSYSFSGRFLKGGIFAAANLDDQTPVLEGVLTKLRNGKKIAEAPLKFVYFGGT